MDSLKIAFVGGGVMGEVMVAAVLDKKLCSPPNVYVSDVNEARRQYLSRTYGVAVAVDNRDVINKGDIVVMAIKPQQLPEVMSGIAGQFNPSQLVLSIIAGARIDTLRRGLGHDLIVRVMPNTPAQIGDGMSVWTATDGVTRQQKKHVSSVLSAMGKEIYVADEKIIDMATAVSGSGPAYFFLMVESMIDAAVRIGLAPDVAEELVVQTMVGAGHLIQQSDKSPAELRRMVTSPGGTTAEALHQFEQGDFPGLIFKAVSAAYDKAKKLGN